MSCEAEMDALGPPVTAPQMHLDFLIFGAEKSGSTWLHHLLKQHPQVFMPDGETPSFEDPDYGAGDMTELVRLTDSAPQGKIIGIKRPSYLTRQECPMRIKTHFPEAKLIAILREPASRAISAYFHMVRVGLLRPEDPSNAFRKLLDGKYEPAFGQQILDYGFYGRGLSLYSQHFAAEQILVLTSEQVISDTAKRYRQVCRFLSISDRYTPRNMHKRRNGGLYSPALLHYLHPLNQHRFTLNYDVGRVVAKHTVLAKSVNMVARTFQFFSSVEYSLWKKRASDMVSGEILDELKRFYRRDVELLETMLGRDLSAWK